MIERKGHKFAAVLAAITRGASLTESCIAHGVSMAGYQKCRKRHNTPAVIPRLGLPDSVFKAAEREIRSGKIFFIAQKHGLHVEDLYHRKKSTGDESIRLAQAIAEVQRSPKVEAICKKHGITRGQLYAWRHATGGLPKTLPCESAS